MGPLDNVQLHLVETMRELDEFRAWLNRGRRFMAVDTETTGFSPEKDKVRLIQFGDLNDGWALDWDMWRGPACEVLDRYPGDWILHNSKYDIRMIQANRGKSIVDWPWHRTHDTMGLAHIADSQRPKGLKPLAALHIDGRAVAGEKTLHDGMRENGWDWDTVPIDFDPYWQYGALDPVLTSHIFVKFEHLTREKAHLYDVEMGAIRVAAKMEEQGTRVDLGYAQAKVDELTAEMRQRQFRLRDEWGLVREEDGELLNPTPTQLLTFFSAQGVELMEKFTNSGQQAMDKHVLEVCEHPVAKEVLALRKAEKLVNTYLNNLTKFSDSKSFLHPNIITMAARTGRMAITNPALQTLPKRDKTVRNAFIPREGHVMLSIDADQIEARLTAHFSNDPGLINAFFADEDFFCVIATQAFGYPVTKAMVERALIKGVVYGKVYGASVIKMAETAGVPIISMERTNAAFDTSFPRVKALMRDVTNTGKSRARENGGRGYVITPYNRVLQSDYDKEYTLVNYLIQCHASEILKTKLVQLDAALPDYVKMLIPVHDEILFDIPEDEAPPMKALAEEVLNESDGYKVPITWSGDLMPISWGAKED